MALEVGGVELRGANPCQRCVVPTRDPDTGEEHPGLRERFVAERERTLPEWAERSRFDHFFGMAANTVVPESEWGEELRVGDRPAVLGERPALAE
jgi:uncharacterized protein YcbX